MLNEIQIDETYFPSYPIFNSECIKERNAEP